ncbi:MAG: HEPN domain-containing protein [Candidatus Aminicenantes bacterium]|nr:HEPN domain-containing protein [Candidatus Aminicenantes bacterium]NIM79084.1 HEPN domain-containing protein [Candidatus Aminicenantes bacterium]NIN18363.1 HEPN domain-containing protein [Candidatus Aminicenantes bacterium]NIN42250.1 HEPN domain-containing protein [Candidatus Aminicenantes bacterium]NIN85016.1 HEPN domain-containing protein [Candidatus Aminicenantes bacterium]
MGSVLKYRLQQAEESVKDAEILYDGGGSPRGVINFSYYSMFYSALSLVLQKGRGNLVHANPHAEVLAIFDREYIDTGVFPKEMSEIYHRAYDLRKEYDYQESNSISEEEIVEIMSGAKEFLSRIKPYLEVQQRQNHISQLLRFLEVIRGKFSAGSFD